MNLNPSYYFIADQNPQGCIDLCNQYGYADNFQSTQDIAACLQQIAQDNGESALQDIFTNHPDREIILHLYNQGRTNEYGVDNIDYRKRTIRNFYHDAGPVDGQQQPILIPDNQASSQSGNKSYITISSDTVFLCITIFLGFYIVSINKNK